MTVDEIAQELWRAHELAVRGDGVHHKKLAAEDVNPKFKRMVEILIARGIIDGRWVKS